MISPFLRHPNLSITDNLLNITSTTLSIAHVGGHLQPPRHELALYFILVMFFCKDDLIFYVFDVLNFFDFLLFA